ncbi:MAG: hypothetical protein V1722_01445 [Candidatus Micrarchaeota archaeon]
MAHLYYYDSAPPHFSEKSTRTLGRMLVRLSDFMHKKGIKQIVGIGPTATPYVRAIARAHANRYGVKLKVVALGHAGERISRAANDISIPLAADLLSNELADCRKKTLLFDEIVDKGTQMKGIKAAFKHLQIPHETATFAKHPRSCYSRLSFVGGNLLYLPWDFIRALQLRRGQLLSDYYSGTPGKRRYEVSLAFDHLRKVRKELREIANSVPRK